MELITIQKDDSKNQEAGLFVYVTQQEAISLIRSLSSQIAERCSNSGRLETHDKNGKYFSIGVDFTETKNEISDINDVAILKEKIRLLEVDNKRMNDSWYKKFYGGKKQYRNFKKGNNKNVN